MSYKMKANERPLARKNLDKKLNTLRNISEFARPPRGWIKAIRESLGMTTKQLGQRIGVSQPRALEIEKNEMSGTLSLDSLERAARALDCHLVYAIVPNEPLDTMIEKRAHNLARSRLERTAHSMSLENQSVSAEDAKQQLQELTRQLAEKSSSELWEDE